MIHVGNCLDVLPTLAAGSAHTCVTSPPYFGLRDYGVDGQIGLEPTPAEFVEVMVCVFREVRRVLRDDGTLWLNLGDSYAGSRSGPDTGSTLQGSRRNQNAAKDAKRAMVTSRRRDDAPIPRSDMAFDGYKPKDMMGMPWRVAFALQADGWYLRQDIIWHKPNPMPESVTDRCTKAHEYLFLLSKSPKYYFDAEAIREQASFPKGSGNVRPYEVENQRGGDNANLGGSLHKIGPREFRNKRSVWTVATRPFDEAHFATFPETLIEPCILAGAPVGGVVLDPFLGAGTTGVVAQRLGRQWVGCELNPAYAEMASRRIYSSTPGLALESAI